MSERYRFGPFELEASEHSLCADGRPVAMTGRVFDTLLYLVRHPGRLVTRDELIAAVWGDTIVEEGNLHWTISAVRRALAQESAEPFIETVRGLGYRFLAPVEVVAAAGQDLVEAATPSPPPRPERFRLKPWQAAVLGAVLLGLLIWVIAGWVESAAAAKGAGVAVIGFRNLSPQGADGWVGGALTEMLAADLGQGGPLRLIPGDDVASMQRDLSLQRLGPLGPTEIAQIQRRLGSEWVIVGSYLRLEGVDPPLRIDVLLVHAGSGETRATLSRRGRETDLFALADSLAGELRMALGAPVAEKSGEAQARGAMPQNPEALRLYAEGIERLHQRDPLAAAERLKAATAADPAFPGAWLALARAEESLGSSRLAEDAALKAVERSNGLPEPQRLAAEAAWLRIARRLPEAVDRLRRLYELSQHAFEDGLSLAETESRAGQTREALATAAELIREHPASRDDARLAQLEADVYSATENFPKVAAAAERALTAARRQKMVEIEIRALERLAGAHSRLGAHAACDGALTEIGTARQMAEATGDRYLLAGVLISLGSILSDCEQLPRAEQTYREAIELFRDLGALGRLPALLYNLGSLRLDDGDLLEADSLMREALDTCQAYGILCRERFLHPVGVNRLHRGELAEARRMIEEGIELNQRLNNRNRVAEARSFLPDLAFWSGDLAQAVELERQVLALRREIGVARGIAWAESDLADGLAEAGRGAEAVATARQAVALAEPLGATTLTACSHASLALAQFVAGDLKAADGESARAIALLRPPRNPFCSFQIWRVRAQVLLGRGEFDAAEALIDQGLTLARRNGFVAYELAGRLLRAQLALARGSSAEAGRLAIDLGAEARAKGFGLIAQRCEGVIAAARMIGPKG